MPDDILDGLTLMKNIQHQIVLILGTSSPNQPYYWMSPKEHKIIQGQVEKLIRKGEMGGSMSPCVIPALLTPKKDSMSSMC
jgi:hypothetical protein